MCRCLCLLSQLLRLAHGAAWGPSTDPRFSALFARARVAIAWHAGVDHADYEEEHNGGVFGGQQRRHNQHGPNSVLGPATLERLMRALQTGALPLCARRLLAALLGLPSQMEISTATALGADTASTTATGASTTASAATAAELESAQRKAPEAVTAPRSGEEEVALRSGWLHHDQRRQLLLFMKDWGLSVGSTAKLFRMAHQRASAVGSDAALGATTAATTGHVMVNQRSRLQLS